jgi:poly(3-hydroxybutyrate) depolymerase
MPLSSMSPALVSKDRRPHLAVGSPGSARIISAVAQVVQLWADGHADIAAAVASPRWHTVPPDKYYAETEALSTALASSGGISGAQFPDVATDLVQNDRNAYFGGVHAVTWNKGVTGGAADPRRDGVVSTVEAGAVEFPVPGPGRFVFTDAMGREIPVWYWAPADTANAPVHFVFHGVGRNADDYRDQWIDVARAKKILLIVPEFTTGAFPGSRSYNNGNLYARGGEENPSNAWSFSVIEPLFDAVRERFGSNATNYTIYGHSAGSQFVHRFLMHKPDARVRQAVFANAGSYTFLWPTIDYPHGLRGARVSQDDLRAFFARRATVLLGDADTDPNYPSLDRSDNALLQGPHRFDRGKAFFIAAREYAEASGWEFNWDLQFVPGVAHSNTLMAPPAGDLLFPAN